MVRQYSSTAVVAALTAGINSSVGTMVVDSVSGFPLTFPYTLSIDAENVSKEIVEVTAAAGTTLTVTRGVDGTTGVSHSLGAVVRHDHSARDFAESRAHEAATSSVHGVTGALVGATQTQALTNKDLSSASNTFPSSHLTQTNTKTVQNKDLTHASNTFPATLATAADLTAHIDDTTDAHDASAISFSPTGTVAATDVQAAIAEVASEGVTNYVPKSLADAKGDLWVASAADTPARLAVGANGAELVADSAQSTGLRWTTALRFEGSGSPEGVVTAPVASSYQDTANGIWYIKATGAGNTGWLVASTGNPYVELTSSSVTSIPHNTVTKVGLDTTDHIDGGAAFYTVTAGVVTIVQDGTYNFNYTAEYATSAQKALLMFMLKQGGIGGASRAKTFIDDAQSFATSPALSRYPVTAGETFQLVGYHFQSSGSAAVNALAGARLVIEKVG